VLIIRDDTESAAAIRELHEKTSLAEVGALVAGIAHEVRNPLFGLSATLEAWQEEAGGEARFEPYSRRAHREIERLAWLMRELLELGRPRDNERVVTDPREVVAAALSACQPAMRERDLTIDLQLAADLPLLDCEPRSLAQVFQNLIENAASFSPAAGVIRIAASATQSGDRAGVECRIEDRGPGFAAGDLDKVFQPFFTRRKGGTGLGMAIVRRIVSDHGGRVRVENRPQGGARVIVWLPAAQPGRG
jgi:signal transduction histidine kinase